MLLFEACMQKALTPSCCGIIGSVCHVTMGCLRCPQRDCSKTQKKVDEPQLLDMDTDNDHIALPSQNFGGLDSTRGLPCVQCKTRNAYQQLVAREQVRPSLPHGILKHTHTHTQQHGELQEHCWFLLSFLRLLSFECLGLSSQMSLRMCFPAVE